MQQDLNPNVFASTCCMFVPGYFHLLGMRKTRKYTPCSKVGLDLWKWMRLKETSKLQTAFTKYLDIHNLQSVMLKQHWAPFYHLLGNISACWSPIYSKKGSCNRSAGGDMVRIKCWVCHFNGTIMLVLHVGLRPLCKWFSVQLSPWSGESHFGISLLVARFIRPAFFLFFESFHIFMYRYTAQVYSFGLGLHFSSHAMITLLLLVCATYIWCCSSRTSRSWWITQSTQHHRRDCNSCSILTILLKYSCYILLLETSLMLNADSTPRVRSEV